MASGHNNERARSSGQALHKDFYLRHPEPLLQCESFCWGNLEAAHPVLGSRSQQEVAQYHGEHGIVVETIRGRPAPKPFQSFEETSFPDFITELAHELFTEAARPKPPQAQAWPCALSGMDMIVVSPTGSGKTLAYLLPALVHMMAQPELGPGEGPIALVLVPTRELARQTLAVAQGFCERTRGRDTLRARGVFGGVDASLHEPAEGAPDFGRWPELLIATPGRLRDLLQQQRLSLERTTYIVVDEADLLILPGLWVESVRFILSASHPEHQLIFTAATWPEEAHKTAVELCGDELVWVKVEPSIPQDVRLFGETEEFTRGQASPMRKEALLHFLQSECPAEDALLLFCANRSIAEELMQDSDICDIVGWSRMGTMLDSASWSGEGWESYQKFARGELRLLITTFALGSRGLDYMDTMAAGADKVPLSLTVVLFDFPFSILEYTHCIGRTMRPGHSLGRVVAFLPEVRFWIAQELQELLRRCGQAVPEALSNLVVNNASFIVQCNAAMLRLKSGLPPWPELSELAVMSCVDDILSDVRGEFDPSICLWTLSASLPSYRRRLLHSLADEHNLPHVSTGRPPSRSIHVARDRNALPDCFFWEGEAVWWQSQWSGGRSTAAQIVDPKIKAAHRTVRIRLDSGKERQVPVDELRLAAAYS